MSIVNVFPCPPASYEGLLSSLTKLHVRCIEDGAELSFVLPIQGDEVYAHWDRMLPSIMAKKSIIFVAIEEETKELLGCVVLTPAWQPNAPHRADVTKLIVDRSARGRGVSSRLMKCLEDYAKEIGKTLLILDTSKGSDAEFIYRKWGWIEVGDIPNYAYGFDGSTMIVDTIFYKQI